MRRFFISCRYVLSFFIFCFCKWYWKMLLEEPVTFRKVWCRLRNHPCGPVWYSNKLEPDMRCKNCGDEL